MLRADLIAAAEEGGAMSVISRHMLAFFVLDFEFLADQNFRSFLVMMMTSDKNSLGPSANCHATLIAFFLLYALFIPQAKDAALLQK